MNLIEKYKVHFNNSKWVGYRICPSCSRELEYTATERYYVLRNIKNAQNKNTLCISCTMTGENNHFFGKKHTPEQLQKLINNRTGKGVGMNNAMSKPEYRKKVAVALKSKYDSGSLDFLKEIQRLTMKQSIVSGKLLNKNISKPEIEIINNLSNLNFTVSGQFRIGTYRFDVFVKELNLLIEYNGDYWHCNPKKYDKNYFNHKKSMYAYQLWDYDNNKSLIAKNNNYNIEIIWESDYKKDKESTINNILNKYGK